jgi:hypothetical protein
MERWLVRQRRERNRRKHLQRRVEAAIRQVPIPEPFDLPEYLRRVEALRRRPIRLYPIPPGLRDVPVALWLPDDARDLDLIFVDTTITSWHRDLCILHECGHMLLDHRPSPEVPRDYSWLGQLFSHLDPAAVRTVLLCRELFDEDQEREAELFAAILAARAVQQAGAALPTGDSGEAAAALARLARVLGGPKP